MMGIRKTTIVLSALVMIAGCASTTEQGEGDLEKDKTVAGAIIGGIVGGVMAHNVGSKQSTAKTVAGAAVGAAVGGAIGHSMDEKERRLREIADERDVKAMEVERLRDDLLRVSVSSEASFDFDKSEIKPEFRPTLDKVADVLRGDQTLQIRIVGHTDSVGSETYNQQLSENRARATADYLISSGVSATQIETEGRGELEPRASNENAAGRAQNRRVEIYLQEV